jgi:hypothetical protein
MGWWAVITMAIPCLDSVERFGGEKARAKMAIFHFLTGSPADFHFESDGVAFHPDRANRS